MENLKVCSRCKLAKPPTEFPVDRSRLDGLRYWCKECYYARTKERYRENGHFKDYHTSANSNHWTPLELSWLAGLMEGEGTFCLKDGRPSCSVHMTDLDIIERAQAVAGMGTGPYFVSPKEEHWKPSWVWRVGNHRHALALMWALYPWMGTRRREQIRMTIDAWHNLGP